MKQISALITALLFLFGTMIPGAAYEELSTDAKACIVIEAESGRILGGHNIHERLPMASTTKIMTALLALEADNLDEWFTVDSDAIRVEGSSMGLQEGDQVTLRSLVYGMLLPSGNDAAQAAAVRLSGDQSSFVTEMNRRAEELGLENTQFQNASGLDADGHYSSAYDMAQLCRVAMKNETFREICCLSKAQVEFGNPPYRRWLENYNKLLTLYPYCIGVKTGFTEAAYRCLVSAAEKDGVTLICVTLNCPDDWSVHENLYEYYFSKLYRKSFEKKIPHELPLTVDGVDENGGNRAMVTVKSAEKIEVSLLQDDEVSLEIFRNPMIFTPVSEGEVLGEIHLSVNGEVILQTELLAAENIRIFREEKQVSLIDRIHDFIIKLF